MSPLRTITMALTAAALAACASPPEPKHPLTFATESQDEWLERHCESRGYVITNTTDFNREMAKRHANFAELVGQGRTEVDVKTFACRAVPKWYRGNVEERPEDL